MHCVLTVLLAFKYLPSQNVTAMTLWVKLLECFPPSSAYSSNGFCFWLTVVLFVCVYVCVPHVSSWLVRETSSEKQRNASAKETARWVTPPPHSMLDASARHLYKSFFIPSNRLIKAVTPQRSARVLICCFVSKDSQQMPRNHSLQMHATQWGHNPFHISSI